MDICSFVPPVLYFASEVCVDGVSENYSVMMCS